MFEAPSHSQAAVVRRNELVPAFAPAGDFDLKQLCSTLWRGKTTILISIIVALVLAVLFVLIMPYKYTATTQILIDPMELHSAGNELTSPSQQSDAAVLTVESQVRVLTSDNLLTRVVAAEGLDHDPEFVRGALSLEHASLAALNELKRHLSVSRADRTYVIDVSVTSEDPAKAARIANAIAKAYLAGQTEVRSDNARQMSQSLSGRLKELQDRVRDSENRVEAYKSSHNIVGANGELVDEQQLTSLNAQLSAAHARTEEAKSRLDQIEGAKRSKTDMGAFPAAIQSQTITALRTQYAEIMRREAEQKTSLGERHPAVIEIEAQAERLQHMIDDEVARIALSARAEYQSAKTNEDTLTRNLDTLKQTAMSTNESLVGLRELEREVQANRAVYEAFLVRARETGEQERVDTKNIRIISKADLPLKRSWPPPSLVIALAALMLGAAIGTGIVLMRDTAENDVPRGRPADISPPKWRTAVRTLWPVRSASSDIPVLATLPQIDVGYALDAVEDAHSSFAREMHEVHEAIRANHRKRGNPSVLVVASDCEDDSTAVALMLAAVAAATERVLLIDADLKRRTLTAIDADQNDAGLVDVAVGRRELSEVIVRDRETNINLVPFVAENSRRDRAISDADIKHAFDMTKRFDMVIVAAVDLSRDPSIRFFAGLVDHIVLVARPDEKDKRAVDQFVARLGADAKKVRGAVLIGV
jgi:polysaccharide biosynthesis transport protein